MRREPQEEAATPEANPASEIPAIPQTEEELAAFLGFSLDDLNLDTLVVGIDECFVRAQL